LYENITYEFTECRFYPAFSLGHQM